MSICTQQHAVSNFPIVFRTLTTQAQEVRQITVRTEVQSSQTPDVATKAAPSTAVSLPSNWLESGAALLDRAGRITETDDALASWLGRPRAELVGHSFWDLLAGFLPESTTVLKETAEGTAAFSRISLKSGTAAGPAQQSLVLEVARNGSGSFVRLNSALPPLERRPPRRL